MRAAQTQSLLAAVRRLPSNERSEVLAQLRSDTVPEIESGVAVAWLPMSIHMELSDALRATVGPTRNVEIWRRTMTASFDRPFLRGFVRMTTSLLGLSPLSLFRRAESIYGHVTRDVGSIHFESTGKSEGVVELRGYPARELSFPCYVEGLQGCLLACFDVCRTDGRVTVHDQDDRAGEATYHLIWDEVR